MKVRPENILPSQNFLKPQTLTYILECISNGELDKLPPNPIVRLDGNGKMIAIDGHNLIAVRLLRREDINVHVAKSAEDGLPETSEANIQRNQDLREKFESVLEDRSRLEAESINSFYDLVAGYGNFLKSQELGSGE